MFVSINWQIWNETISFSLASTALSPSQSGTEQQHCIGMAKLPNCSWSSTASVSLTASDIGHLAGGNAKVCENGASLYSFPELSLVYLVNVGCGGQYFNSWVLQTDYFPSWLLLQIVLENSSREDKHECPFGRSSIELTKMLCEILKVGELRKLTCLFDL